MNILFAAVARLAEDIRRVADNQEPLHQFGPQ